MRRRWETTNNQVPWRQLGDKAFLMAQWVENLPAMQETQETQLRSLGQEDSLEEEMATHSSILAGKIPWRGAWWASVHEGLKELDRTEQQSINTVL